MLPKLAGIGTWLKVWGDMVANNHIESKRGGKFELQCRQLEVEDHIGEKRALFGGVEREGGREEEGFCPLQQMAGEEGFRGCLECAWRGVKLVRERGQGGVGTSRPTLQGEKGAGVRPTS